MIHFIISNRRRRSCAAGLRTRAACFRTSHRISVCQQTTRCACPSCDGWFLRPSRRTGRASFQATGSPCAAYAACDPHASMRVLNDAQKRSAPLRNFSPGSFHPFGMRRPRSGNRTDIVCHDGKSRGRAGVVHAHSRHGMGPLGGIAGNLKNEPREASLCVGANCPLADVRARGIPTHRHLCAFRKAGSAYRQR